MAKIAKFIAFNFLTLFVSVFVDAEESKSEDYGLYVQQIVSPVAKELEKEFGIICTGGGGRMPNDVEEIEITFVAYKKATIEEARQIEVKATEKLLKAINAHEKIKPYLRDYPFKSNRAKISLSFRKKDNSCYRDGSVVHVLHVKNKIHYFSEDALTQSRILLKDEPYEEAVKVLEAPSSKKGTPLI